MKTSFIRLAVVGAIMMLLLASCGAEQPAAHSTMDYKELKSMVIDILKSEEGQKAVQSAHSGGTGGGMQMQALTIQQQEQIRMAVKDTLVSPEYEKVIEEVMKDPKFAGEFAKAVNKENKELHKALIKDPTYQQSFGEMLKAPDMTKAYLELMKTPEYRKQMMTLVKDAMGSPLFKLEVMELLSKVVKEELQPEEKGKKKQEGEKGKGGQEGGGKEEGGGESGGGGSSS
ncbi:MAG: spore germination lipoprotein GerD [Paenibacillus dendritiformis]|uniref:spore germination lipoprotein GerD n=1 Tax=Paenibacillus dendritiformis TaxID=130049 RepID=UPI00143CDCE9|nr:spore germination lipoprotein GerD [Paenibacillus dendritiformis]MDU5144666.1 spore germination lipoprotein GerD [Paenibacillus dendritiformis]NKI24131.1 spore gernimation protein [Paenibacillus dendritiformis]NRF98109.1 spore gernimation protein [Paenibacillus dendritiformis]GIO75916.1 spore germination protein GerD [Paenibacillus dendritiformis]